MKNFPSYDAFLIILPNILEVYNKLTSGFIVPKIILTLKFLKFNYKEMFPNTGTSLEKWTIGLHFILYEVYINFNIEHHFWKRKEKGKIRKRRERRIIQLYLSYLCLYLSIFTYLYHLYLYPTHIYKHTCTHSIPLNLKRIVVLFLKNLSSVNHFFILCGIHIIYYFNCSVW